MSTFCAGDPKDPKDPSRSIPLALLLSSTYKVFIDETKRGFRKSFFFEKKMSNIQLRFVCPICREKNWWFRSVNLSCRHRTCKNCFRNQVASVKPVKCCLCEMQISLQIFLRSNRLPDELVRGWNYFEKSTDPLLSECHHCRRFNKKPLRGFRIVCACGQNYCFTHGGAHASTTSCRRFEWDQRQKDSSSFALITEITKLCPSCRVPIQKNRGCDHMTCKACGCHFCWRCRTSVPPGRMGEHLHMCIIPVQRSKRSVSIILVILPFFILIILCVSYFYSGILSL